MRRTFSRWSMPGDRRLRAQPARVRSAAIAADTRILETENPQFDQMMAAIAEFEEAV
ncbi:hypothetical protein DESC_830027 [Desulfosarcina cetonica]|nr:hypothetical protein DESC_830027 [Desulfosarcina cetonica]